MNRIDVTRYWISDISWVLANGYTVKYDYDRNRVYLVR